MNASLKNQSSPPGRNGIDLSGIKNLPNPLNMFFQVFIFDVIPNLNIHSREKIAGIDLHP